MRVAACPDHGVVGGRALDAAAEALLASAASRPGPAEGGPLGRSPSTSGAPGPGGGGSLGSPARSR